jgi:DNA-binding NtrC family response regulator
MATAKVKRSVLLLAQPAIALRANMELTATGKVSVKSASTVKEALTAIPQARPAVLIIESGTANTGHIMTAKQLAELSASRKVPIVIVGGPLDAATVASRPALGIAAVIDGEWNTQAVLDAIEPIFNEMDEKEREKQAVEDARVDCARPPATT